MSFFDEVERRPRSTRTPDPETDLTIPDGEYDAQVSDWRSFRSKAGAWFLKWTMEVTGGDQAGKILVYFKRFPDEGEHDLMAWLKNDLYLSLGRDPAEAELKDEERGLSGSAKREIEGAVLRVRKVASEWEGKPSAKVYLNATVKLATEGGAPSAAPSGTRPVEYVDGDEIPF